MINKLTGIKRQANALIVENVENYRHAAAAHNKARKQFQFDKQPQPPGAVRPPTDYANPELAMKTHKMQMDRASGALDALHRLYPTLPAWTETKWIH